MLIQLTKDIFVNTKQINYIKEFEDIGDRLKPKIYISFTNKDSLILPITIKELTEVINYYGNSEEG